MTTELTTRVNRAEAKVYLVQGRTKMYVTTVLCINNNGNLMHGMPFTATCNCKHGRMQEETTDAKTGCRHVKWALAQAHKDYKTERDAR